MKKRILGILALLVLVALAVVACGKLNEKQKQPADGSNQQASSSETEKIITSNLERPYGPPSELWEGVTQNGPKVYGKTEVITGSGWYYHCGAYETLGSPEVKAWWADMGWDTPRECCDYLLDIMVDEGWQWDFDYEFTDEDGRPLFLEDSVDPNEAFRARWLELKKGFIDSYREED